MAAEESWEYSSLEWIHKIREAHYERTKDLPLKSWLKPADPEEALRACERLGLKVRPRGTAQRKGSTGKS